MKKKQLHEALAVLLTKLSSARDNPLLMDNYAVKALRTVLLNFKESGELHEAYKEQMMNVDGTSHRWTVDEIRLATNNEIISKGTTIGDILYLANMAYADFYPKVIKTESDCVQYAIAVASDPDGYEGMAFCRWTADIIGKGVTIDWEKLE